MKSLVKYTLAASALSLCVGSAYAERSLAELEREYHRLKAASEKNQVKANRLSISGYASVGFARTDAPVTYLGDYLPDVPTSTNTDAQSKAGIQFDYKINDRASATVQVSAQGVDDFDVKMEYGFIKWAINEDNYLRFGRLRLPFYKYSDSLNAIYSQPWGTQPSEIYGIAPGNSLSGVDYLGYFSTGDIEHSINVFGGTTSVGGSSFDEVAGASWGMEWNNFNIRGMYVTTRVENDNFWSETAFQLLGAAQFVCQSINEAPNFSLPVSGPGPLPAPAAGAANGCATTPVPEAIQFQQHALQLLTAESLAPVDDSRIEFVSAAAEYNHSLFYVLGEWATANASQVLQDYDAYYATFGLNLPFNLSPYYTIGKIETTDDEDRSGPAYSFIPGTLTAYSDSFLDRTVNVHQRSDRLGVRWDAGENIAVFVDAERYHDFRGTRGLFDPEVATLAANRKLNNSDEHFIYRFTIAARF